MLFSYSSFEVSSDQDSIGLLMDLGDNWSHETKWASGEWGKEENKHVLNAYYVPDNEYKEKIRVKNRVFGESPKLKVRKEVSK